MITVFYRVCLVDYYKITILAPYAHHAVIRTEMGLLSSFSYIAVKGEILRMTGKFEYRNDLFYHRLIRKQGKEQRTIKETDNPHAYIHLKSLRN